MSEKEREERRARYGPYLQSIRQKREPNTNNKPTVLRLMQDLKDEGNDLFRENQFKEAREFYNYALDLVGYLEKMFYESVDGHFQSTLNCNASLCSIKIEDYHNALEDAEKALKFERSNVKAMFRRTLALKELGRYQEAMQQAQEGYKVDPNNFTDFIEELTEKLGLQKDKPETIKSEWLEGTNALVTEQRKAALKKSMPPKKKKASSSSGATKSSNSSKVQNAAVAEEPSEDSDSVNETELSDSEMAAHMASLQKNVLPAAQSRRKKKKKKAAKAGGGGSDEPAKTKTNTQPITVKKTASITSNMGLDAYMIAAKKSSPVSIQWPFGYRGYKFQLACTTCFVKESEGIGGTRYLPNHPHPCRYDVLLVRKETHDNWLKIRPRFVTSGPHVYGYKLCFQYRSKLPCRLGESNCTFAHSPVEIMIWEKDRDREFSIANFLREAKKENIYSSEILAERLGSSASENFGKAEANIPGLNYVDQSRQTASPHSVQVPAQQYVGGLQQIKIPSANRKSTVFFNSSIPENAWQEVKTHHHAKSPPSFGTQTSNNVPSYAAASSTNTNNVPTYAAASSINTNNLPTYAAGSSTNTYSSPPGGQQYSGLIFGDFTSPMDYLKRSPPKPSGFPDLSQPPPKASAMPTSPSRSKLKNPLPGQEYRLCCSTCLHFTGIPWLYNLVNSKHNCSQIWLAYNEDKRNPSIWVKVRERLSHRHFKGHYIICHSVKKGMMEACKYKETCSFAHNMSEQTLWKMEQRGEFDIGEFIMSNRSVDSMPSSTGRVSEGVKYLVDKFGGYFDFICRPCYFQGSKRVGAGTGGFCAGDPHHPWEQCKTLAHVLVDRSRGTSWFTIIDSRKFMHKTAFFTRCRFLQFCRHYSTNQCGFAHSDIERQVWMVERDTNISREDLVLQSKQLFAVSPQDDSRPSTSAWGLGAPSPQNNTKWHGGGPDTTSSVGPAVSISQFCRTCWGTGQRCEEDGDKDKCTRGHSNFKVNCVFIAVQSGKEVRQPPDYFPPGLKLVMCAHIPNCKRPTCTHPHNPEEMTVWTWMIQNAVKNLKDVVQRCQKVEKSRTRKISQGESVVMVEKGLHAHEARPANPIFAPGDLVLSEHYCSYCGITCNSSRQWDDHCMSQKHVTNVNSDKEHQWNYRQPPWGQNLALCHRHLYDKSCQFSIVPDQYNLCKYAHSQEELDEWRERMEWRQMKREVAKERHMFSYTEVLLDEYYKQENSVTVISESVEGVTVKCQQDLSLYKNEKNAIFTWDFQVYTQVELEKVALLLNKDRLHFALKCQDSSSHQVAPGDLFLDVDDDGHACYKVTVTFTGGMFGSFGQWVVFDFGSKPVLVRKLTIEIGSQLQHQKVKELRENLSINRWTSENREIIRAEDAMSRSDPFTNKLMLEYRAPTESESVVTGDSLVELNRNNYRFKMHSLLRLEELTCTSMIASYNIVTTVTFSKALDVVGVFLFAKPEELFMKVQLSENLTLDTVAGKLLHDYVTSVLFVPTDMPSNQVYEANIVTDVNYTYDGRGKEHIYIVVGQKAVSALGLSDGTSKEIELQFQMDRKRFCRMHFAVDSLKDTDVIFPDVINYRPNLLQLGQISSQVLNEDQMMAVRHIITERDSYTPPFIMYGPFGTGKTETLAQAVMALLKSRSGSVRILICTQSNSAADLYIQKHFSAFLKKTNSCQMLRLIATERKVSSVPQAVLPYCNWSDAGNSFFIPTKDEIMKYNVVLTTVENSMQLVALGLYNFFTHIFIDEAGQILECEALMPLTLASRKTCVVLTGDHNQISPQVYSQEARRQKFDVSILVRLHSFYEQMSSYRLAQVTEKAKQSPLNILLSINYRTKLEILRFISSVFYGGPDVLKAYGKIPSVVHISPLMFYAVQGKEVQNADSLSYLNHAEALEVVQQVESLLDDWPEEWGPRDAKSVAVITNYRDQLTDIRRLLRQKKRKPWLREVHALTIQSLQGQEFRALFITTVRTTNLLREQHIVQALKSGEDISDLGFLSNPKMLNTALTRAQSFVGVVGDPVALCLIGDCVQVWRTYLKHCSNMNSLKPDNVTFDFVRNQVIQIQRSPEGEIVNLIWNQSHENYKQNLKARKQESAQGNPERNPPSARSEEQSTFQGKGDRTPTSQQSPLGMQHLLSQSQSSTEFADMKGDQIVFEMVKEFLGQDLKGPECVWIEEVDGFAVLKYSDEHLGLRKPFRLVSDRENFEAFVSMPERKIFENWGPETLNQALIKNPSQYVRCIIFTDGENAVARVLGPVDESAVPAWLVEGAEIAIPGLLNRGHAFSGDEVVVFVDERTQQGRVQGVLSRAVEVTSRLLVCTADEDYPGILCPINPDLPRLYCLTSQNRLTLARKGKIGVYNVSYTQDGSTTSVEFSHYEKLDVSGSSKQLFIVKYLAWQPGFLLPLGVVVGKMEPGDTLERGMKVLEVEHNIHRNLRPAAQLETERLFPEGSMVPGQLLINRQDLTGTYCFTIGAEMTEDLEMAVSISQKELQGEMIYEVSVHVSDVSAFIEKGSVLDKECAHRGNSLFPLGTEPQHLLPSQLCLEMCSLRPGFDRLAVSTTIKVNKDGQMVDVPEVFRSVVHSKQHFSHNEVQDILLCPSADEGETEYLHSCIMVLYQLTFRWREDRLGNAHLSSDLPVEESATQHSQIMMNELKIKMNSIMATVLLSKFDETIPLLIQQEPPQAKLEEWRRAYAGQAMMSIPLTRAFLADGVCKCTRTCTCVFQYWRQNRLPMPDTVTFLKDSWETISEAVSETVMNFELAQDLITTCETKPDHSVAARRLEAIQPLPVYACSGLVVSSERKHYKLCVGPCTSWLSPLRQYLSLVVQRMIVAAIEGTENPYNPLEVAEICAKATKQERAAERFHKAVFTLHLSAALKEQPLFLQVFVEKADDKKIVLNMPSLGRMPEASRTLDVCDMRPQSVDFVPISSGQVAVQWEERIYSLTDSRPCEPEVQLEPNWLVHDIPAIAWQKLLIAIREKDEDSISANVKAISKTVEKPFQDFPKVLSTEGQDGRMRHFVKFGLFVKESLPLQVQLCAQVTQGMLRPSVQLVCLAPPNLNMCLEHYKNPDKCFADPKAALQAQTVKLDSEDEVLSRLKSLLPVLALESAESAVSEGERVTVHDVSLQWSEFQPGQQIIGNLRLSRSLCEKWNFQPDDEINLANALLANQSMYCEDSSFNLGYLCLRYLDVPESTEGLDGIEEEIASLVTKQHIFNCTLHCRVTNVKCSDSDFWIEVALLHSGMRLPRKKPDDKVFTMEWIQKSNQHRLIDLALRGIGNASQFAKEIFSGKKPTNTIDPLPQDSSVLLSKMSEQQEEAISRCFQQPFTVVEGVPGSGKSLCAARLAHLFVQRNRMVSSVRYNARVGQLLICAPTERSLDMITGFFQVLNRMQVPIVRVYSEEVEERDFPFLSGLEQTSKIQPATEVMDNVALHHLVRRKENPESVHLLELEMDLTMGAGSFDPDLIKKAKQCLARAQAHELARAMVILCTCETSARPELKRSTNIRQIILDDASLIPEVVAMIPLVVHSEINQLTVFGDSQMPQPRLSSRLAAQYGLHRSLLSRSSTTAIKLTEQFRTIPSVIKFPSSHFYGGNVKTSNSAQKWASVPTIPWPGEAGFPSVFCHVEGREESLAAAPSQGGLKVEEEQQLFNQAEIHFVRNLVSALVQFHAVKENSIHVVSFTQAQSGKIRDFLPSTITVSTVEESLGYESEYVILSCVRSLPSGELQPHPTGHWLREHLGQVANPAIVNLALTRANIALFIVGNQHLLGSSSIWSKVITAYRERQSVVPEGDAFLGSLSG